MKTTWVNVSVWLIAVTVLQAQTEDAEEAARNQGFYVGAGYGPTWLSVSGNERDINGTRYTFDATANDLGQVLYAGYWITENIGLEIGHRGYGKIDVPFSFNNPHDGTSGTGDSTVETDGVSAALRAGFDVGKVRLSAWAAALMWKESYESQFRIPGRAPFTRTFEDDGRGPAVGGGLTYRFKGGWQIETRYEWAQMNDDTMSLLSLGLSYDFSQFYVPWEW